MKQSPQESKGIQIVKAESNLLATVFHIRQEVFVKEQKVAPEEEYDEFEESAVQFLAYWEEKPVGTARWRFTDNGVKLERFAVLPDFRGKGVGGALVKQVLQDIETHPEAKNRVRYLHAQLPAVSLYERYGFEKEGEIFEECKILHYLMKHLGEKGNLIK
ncbi:GNAT family N-acetyltransferase [Pleomorphovibrio marinus]|uniref:GNAT family N-acetyltransferase n=1 Tax=Pleomorphovibrio marinus TaxID=2164132 RepID=UPI000E0A09AB|nr:GNAT family N-acetyltransferase [Pleomorphovibrio marinus]